jgi:tripartite-type tricarboxylate transporter receptor subunit TctC
MSMEQIEQLARRMVRLAVQLACALALGTGPVFAQDYPNKPIRLVLGYPPGGSTDATARVIGPRLGEILGVTVVIENMGGAGGTIAGNYISKSVAPDGYTLLLNTSSAVVIGPHTYQKLSHDPLKDLAPISIVGITPEALCIHPTVAAKSLKELVQLAQKQDVTISSSGNATLPHLSIELFKQISKGRFVHVPYKGAGPAVTDTVAGHVQGVLMDLPAVISFIKDGKLRGIALTANERTEFLPELPTSVEQGFPTLIAINWLGIWAPAKTPRAIINKLHDAIVKAESSPQTREMLARVGVAASTSVSPDAFTKYIGEEYEKWGAIAKQSGARAD